MKRFYRVIPACLLILVAAGAFAGGRYEGRFGDWVSGSGYVRTESRSVPDFNAIEVDGMGTVTLSQGLVQSVSVETDDNILPMITTEVIGGVLHLGTLPDTHITHVTKLEYRITAASIEGITIAGSGSVRGVTPLRSERMTLEIRGSGDIGTEVAVRSLEARIGGSGSISVQGRASELSVGIDGSGSLEARRLASSRATVRIAGSGGASVNAARTLDVNIAGSGSVAYTGAAVLSVQSSGSGSVRRF
ncbi:MAG TPA: head GIN domain-containing protein [Spirochaetia bacterium]|nr:head GIN domain-containing protein [Spirochaetia bacterium]